MAFAIPDTYELDVHDAACLILNAMNDVLIIDCRPFTAYNTLHIRSALNINISKVLRRRLVENKISVKDLLMNSYNCDIAEKGYVILYDARYHRDGPSDSFMCILFEKMKLFCQRVHLLADGFEEFYKHYPELCKNKLLNNPASSLHPKPRVFLENRRPSCILPFLYLGNHRHSLNEELLKTLDINYVLNVTSKCPEPDFLAEGHFMRIPINDTVVDKILPYLPQAVEFLDVVRKAKGRVLVHCFAGISRSATVVVAYVMQHLGMTLDESLRYVKSKRPMISPNFNFLGQLLEYQKELGLRRAVKAKMEAQSEDKGFGVGGGKRLRRRSFSDQKVENVQGIQEAEKEDELPISAFAKMSLDPLPEKEPPKPSKVLKRAWSN